MKIHVTFSSVISISQNERSQNTSLFVKLMWTVKNRLLAWFFPHSICKKPETSVTSLIYRGCPFNGTIFRFTWWLLSMNSDGSKDRFESANKWSPTGYWYLIHNFSAKKMCFCRSKHETVACPHFGGTFIFHFFPLNVMFWKCRLSSCALSQHSRWKVVTTALN